MPVAWDLRFRQRGALDGAALTRQFFSPNDSLGDGLGDRLLAVGDVELGSQMRKVQFHRSLTDPERAGDIPARVAMSGVQQAPLLLRAQWGALKPRRETPRDNRFHENFVEIDAE